MAGEDRSGEAGEGVCSSLEGRKTEEFPAGDRKADLTLRTFNPRTV